MTRGSGFATLAVVVLLSAIPALAGPHDTQPQAEGIGITEVFLDSHAITILGRNFHFGGRPRVTLGELGDLSSGCEVLDPETMFCDLAAIGGMPVAGDYLLAIAPGAAPDDGTAYHLTVGATGPPGAHGATGAAGPRGPPGVSSWSIVEFAGLRTIAVGSSARDSVVCPPGTRVFGGGAGASAAQQVYLQVNQPMPNGLGWEASWVNGAAYPQTPSLSLYAICAAVDRPEAASYATKLEPEMQAGPWWLMQVGGDPTTCTTEAWLEVDLAGFQITGMAGCNELVARFEGSPNDLDMVRVGGTKRLCPEPMMSQERRVYEILSAARSMAVGADGTLEISGQAGNLRAAIGPIRPWCLEPDGRRACVEVRKMRPMMCNAEYQPVCGCDGITYGNACIATAQGVRHYQPGRCEDLPRFVE